MLRAAIVFCLVASSASVSAFGQGFDNQWVEYARNLPMLTATDVSDNDTETDLAWGDLNHNGFLDLVIVRKEPGTTPGKRSNVLLINESGALTDRTALYASTSDVPGDNGFLTPTNDRDVVVTDVDGDGWLDVVTATTLSHGDPKDLGHPRVYLNQGDAGLDWGGIHYETARIPQLVFYASGLPHNPRFASVDAGDVTGDGAPDLYFVDYDSGAGAVAKQPHVSDLNDRLLVNDGGGFFTDESQLRMLPIMLVSTFGVDGEIADMNMDGVNDILKANGLINPTYASVSYNDPQNVGTFTLFDSFHDFEPYHISVGDLNNDGRPDAVMPDDDSDRYRFNIGTDVFGAAAWSGAKPFTFLAGQDDGFASNSFIADLDDDGWQDVLICDVDVDDPIGQGVNRRMNIYHNTGGEVGAVPGSTDVVLQEERENGNDNVSWLGAKGLKFDDMRWTHDVGVFDIDNDGDLDLVISRYANTVAWENLGSTVCQTDLGSGNGSSSLQVCGGDLSSGASATLTLEAAPQNATALLFVGLANNPTFVPELGGTLVPVPIVQIVLMATDSAGALQITVPGGFGPISLFAQFATEVSSGVFEMSNALQIDLKP